MIISISGTPGTGKSYLAKKLSNLTKGKFEYFDLNKYIKENKLYDSYDKKDKTYDVDVKKLSKDIKELYKNNTSKNSALEKLAGKELKIADLIKKFPKNTEGIIIDSHLSHYFESDYCIIVRTDIKILNKRLKQRKYPAKKIQDNIDAEIFQVCLDEARKLKRKVIIVRN
jgi:adenylate kinase